MEPHCVSLLILYYSSTVLSKGCLQNDQCSCIFDDDSGDMDLHNLGLQTGDPLWVIPDSSVILNITKACLYNIDTLTPHLYVVKLGFKGVYVIFLISAQKHRLWAVLTSTYDLCFEQTDKKYQDFIWKFSCCGGKTLNLFEEACFRNEVIGEQGSFLKPFLYKVKTCLKRIWFALIDFPPTVTGETTFVTSCLLSCSTMPFKQCYSKMKEFTSKGSTFFPFGVDLFSEQTK